MTLALEQRFARLRTELAAFSANRGAVESRLAPFMQERGSSAEPPLQHTRAKAMLDGALFRSLRAGDLRTVETCESLYFGLEAPPDQAAARRCLESLGPNEAAMGRTLLALLYTNGQGGPVELAKAKNLLLRAEFSGESPRLLPLVNQRLEQPGAGWQELSFFEVSCETTLEIEHCLSIVERLAGQQHEQKLSQIATGLAPSAISALERLDASFKQLAKLDSTRAYYTFVDGTIRSQVGGSYLLYLRERHDTRLHAWLVEKRPLPPATAVGFSMAQQHLSKALRKANTDYHSLLYPHTRPAYIQALSTGQRSWVAYSTAWSALLGAAMPLPDLEARARELALETLLTEERAMDLEGDASEKLRTFP